MLSPRWLFALPLSLAVSVGSARASSVRDDAGMFDPDFVRTAEAKLNQVEKENGITTTIQTIESLAGQSLEQASIERAKHTGTQGIFILIPKQEHRIRVLVSRSYSRALPSSREKAIEQAFIAKFKDGDFNAGLKDGVQTIAQEVAEARAANGGQLRRAEGPIAPLPGRNVARPRGNQNGFGMGSLLGIGLVILAVLIGIRLLGSLFGGNRGAYGPGPGYGGRPGMGPGMGPGYGSPGYGGGGGGGFMSSLFGGIGGAMAGNWLYDQFSGRHHGSSVDSTSYTPGSDAIPTGDPGGADEWSGGTGVSGDWGGGDAGGGGGDWGGGGGGGDWGGGGGDEGGSW